MARMIRLEADGPHKIEPQDKPVWVCGCGLSQSMPLCDGSHSAARKEDAGTLYVYDKSRCEVCETKAEE